MRTIMTLTLIIAFATSAMAQLPVVADFEGTNNGDWTWGNGADTIEATGGNPAGWFHNDYLNTFAPILRCGWDAPDWTGNYVAEGVVRISGDFQTISATTQYMQYYPFTVMFRNHMGTPNDIEDDIHVYYNPDLQFSPDVGAGWIHYEFDIPTDFVGGAGELPDGWMGGSYMTGNASFPSDATWQDVMSDIGRIEFWFFHPDMFGVYEWFDVGADNIVLEKDGGSVATEDSSWGNLKAIYR